MKIDGQCHCGAIRYEAEINPDWVSICHCTDCQTLTGSPYRVTVFARRENVHLTGVPKAYIKTAESGRKRHQYFCPTCGSPIYVTGEGEGAESYGLRWGAIRQRAQLPPKRAIWCRSAMPWLDQLGALPGKEKISAGSLVEPPRPPLSSPGLSHGCPVRIFHQVEKCLMPLRTRESLSRTQAAWSAQTAQHASPLPQGEGADRLVLHDLDSNRTPVGLVPGIQGHPR
jgi:hypothetical protein